MQFVKANVFFSLSPFLKTPHVWMKMAAKVEFHSGSDEVREHLHSLDPLFFLPLVRDMKRNHPAWRLNPTIQQLNPPADLNKQIMSLIKPKIKLNAINLMYNLSRLKLNCKACQRGGNYDSHGRGSKPVSRLLDWSTCYHSTPLEMHQRYNKWETEHILSSLEQIECLWGVSFGDLVLAPEGGVIAWALVIFFSNPL